MIRVKIKLWTLFLLLMFVLILTSLSGIQKTHGQKLGQSTPIESCDNNLQTPDIVFLDNCVRSPCDVASGHNSSITIVFTPDVDASKFQVRARGRYWIFSRDHDLGRQGSHACEYLMHGQCPLLTGQQVTYRAVSLVEKDEFKVNGIIVTYEVLNDEGEHVMLCFKVEINIVD